MARVSEEPQPTGGEPPVANGGPTLSRSSSIEGYVSESEKYV